MNAAVVYLIRHAEKPDTQAGTIGVDESGHQDPESLTAKGWQRAGALSVWFRDPRNAEAVTRIYAAKPDKHHGVGSHSERPHQTVDALARKLGQNAILTFTKGDEPALASEVASLDGVTLIAWQHEAIPAIVAGFPQPIADVPASWPAGRFDVVWVLTRNANRWTFAQKGQEIFSDDAPLP